MKYILAILSFCSLQSFAQPTTADSMDFYTLASFQWDHYRSRNDFWVVVDVENTLDNQKRAMCVSMKNLRLYIRKTYNLKYDSASIIQVDSILSANQERRFTCNDENDLNRYFNFNKYTENEIDSLRRAIDLDELNQTALNREFQKYIPTQGSEKTMLMLAHLLYEKGIYTTQYSCHGTILYIVNMDQMRRETEKWRIKHK